MNLYFRLIRILLQSMFVRRISIRDLGSINYRVWPFDCDINLHLTNSRYLGLCDLARINFMSEAGILGLLVRRAWLPVVQAQEITYFKPLAPWKKFTVTTALSWWDEKYWYIEHRFLVGEKVHALVHVRGVFKRGRDIIPSSQLVALTGESDVPPEKPESVGLWQQMLDEKKNRD